MPSAQRLLVSEPTEIRHWILGWGRTCIVEAPESLRDAIADEAGAMAQRYSADLEAQDQESRPAGGLIARQPGRRVG